MTSKVLMGSESLAVRATMLPEDEGVGVAWTRRDAVQAIDLMSSAGIAISGVDVWAKESGRLVFANIPPHTCGPAKRETEDAYVQRSKEEAIRFVSKMSFVDGTEPYFSPVPVPIVMAGLLVAR